MKLAILGAGNMGGAIAKGLVRAGAVRPEEILFAHPHNGLPAELAQEGFRSVLSNEEAVQGASVVFVAVKPYLVSQILQPLARELAPGTVLISVAAGVTLADLREDLSRSREVQIVRAMPNTAVGLCTGVTALAAETEAGLKAAKELFDHLGLAFEFPEERFSAITALSGCGIAHALRFLRAGQSAGLQMGIPAGLSGEIFAQVMMGAAALVLRSGNHPETEVDRVCTPGGLTIRGLNVMEAKGFTGAVVQGLLASLPEK